MFKKSPIKKVQLIQAEKWNHDSMTSTQKIIGIIRNKNKYWQFSKWKL
jgi:hypothetical protein